jgi:hypothetical protein
MFTRKLNEDEQSVLNHLVELCCEAYWQEAKNCRICFEQDQLLFIAHINSGWSLIEREQLSLEDYTTIVRTLQGIFEPHDKNVAVINNRIVTVTLDGSARKPIMNLRLDFNGEKTNPAKQVVELIIEDLLEEDNSSSENEEQLDSQFLN